MDVFFSADDRQEYLDLLSQSASKHALDFLAWCLMRNHAHVVVVPCQERSLACTFRRRALQFSVKVAGNLWQERFHSYPMDERKGLGSLMKSSSRSLFSPSTIFRQIRLTRHTIQSYVEFTLFPLEESRFYDAVNSTFLGCSVRVK